VTAKKPAKKPKAEKLLAEAKLVPWRRGEWHGALVSLDGVSSADFGEEDVAEVIAYEETKDSKWDGNAAGVVRLKDGRFVAWEAAWGPTGDGFSKDAYGGNAAILFATTLRCALRGLSSHAHALLVAL
jgi:hypothetical protein